MSQPITSRSCPYGPMDKAPAYGAGDSGFESQYGLILFPPCSDSLWVPSFFLYPQYIGSLFVVGSRTFDPLGRGFIVPTVLYQ